MHARRGSLALIAVVAVGCTEAPTGTTAAGARPLFATSNASAHFVDASASGPTIGGVLTENFKITGLGSATLAGVTGNADGTAVWGCQTTTPGEFDIVPAPQTAKAYLTATGIPSMKSGQFVGAVVLGSPTPTALLQCLDPGKTLTLISASFTSLQVSNAVAGTRLIPGTFSRANFTIAPETGFPTITSVSLANSILTIDGPRQTYSVTIHNPGATRPLVTGFGWIHQGTNFRSGGGDLVSCTATHGELPPGDCTFSLTIGASNDPKTFGQGDLVSGDAAFEFQLWIGNSNRTVDARFTLVTLQ